MQSFWIVQKSLCRIRRFCERSKKIRRVEKDEEAGVYLGASSIEIRTYSEEKQ